MYGAAKDRPDEGVEKKDHQIPRREPELVSALADYLSVRNTRYCQIPPCALRQRGRELNPDDFAERKSGCQDQGPALAATEIQECGFTRCRLSLNYSECLSKHAGVDRLIPDSIPSPGTGDAEVFQAFGPASVGSMHAVKAFGETIPRGLAKPEEQILRNVEKGCWSKVLLLDG